MTKTKITIEFDVEVLQTYTDEFLAQLWHLAQMNQVPHGDLNAGELVSKIGAEIIRRWLRNAPVAFYRHKATDYYWSWLRKFAEYEPPPGVPVDSPEWHTGRWILKKEKLGS